MRRTSRLRGCATGTCHRLRPARRIRSSIGSCPYDVVGRLHRRIEAPAAVTLAVAGEMDLRDSPVARGIFRARELILGAEPDSQLRPRGLLAEVQSMGWTVLAEVPDREIVLGAVTRPWEPNVTFRGVSADRFAAFAEPDYV